MAPDPMSGSVSAVVRGNVVPAATSDAVRAVYVAGAAVDSVDEAVNKAEAGVGRAEVGVEYAGDDPEMAEGPAVVDAADGETSLAKLEALAVARFAAANPIARSSESSPLLKRRRVNAAGADADADVRAEAHAEVEADGGELFKAPETETVVRFVLRDDGDQLIDTRGAVPGAWVCRDNLCACLICGLVLDSRRNARRHVLRRHTTRADQATGTAVQANALYHPANVLLEVNGTEGRDDDDHVEGLHDLCDKSGEGQDEDEDEKSSKASIVFASSDSNVEDAEILTFPRPLPRQHELPTRRPPLQPDQLPTFLRRATAIL
jgi:hypothetical protein